MRNRIAPLSVLAFVTSLVLVSTAPAYFHPGAGRFINRDPYHELGGVNVYCFVHNRPTFSIDPFGMQESQPASKPCCFCGPDATGWLQQELSTVDSWAKQALNEVYDAWPVGIDINYWYAGRFSARIALIKQVASQLTYFPTTTFKSSDCPRCEKCRDTVTLCSMCIHTSEIGNLVYGYLAKALGFGETMRDIGGWYGNRGEQTEQDKASVKAGYFLSPDDVCTYFKNNPNIATDIVKGADPCCSPCASSVDKNSNHIKLPRVERRNIWSPHPDILLRKLPPVRVPPEVQ